MSSLEAMDTQEQFIDVKTVEQQCAILGEILGLQEPVAEPVLLAALADPTYAHNLLVSRGRAKYLDRLLARPPEVASDNDISSLELMRRAGVSLFRWARTGFSQVSEERYQKRLDACNNCPSLRHPPQDKALLYRMAGADGNKESVCGKCGCVVQEKARRVSDTCPDAHPEVQGLNRWNEPMVN